MKRLALLAALLALTYVDAKAADEQCIPSAQLKATADQRNAAHDQVAAIIADATRQIEALKKRVEELTAKQKDVAPK